jgi:hypothetical protein
VFTTSVHQRSLQRVRDVAFDGPVTVVSDKKRWRCCESACSRRSLVEQTAQVPAPGPADDPTDPCSKPLGSLP